MPDVSAKIKGLNVEFNDNLTTSPNIDSGDDIKTSFARIHKRFSQMKSAAYIDASISNNKTITLGDSNIGVVSISQNQGLTDIEKTNARTNIGAGTSNFSGSFNDLTDKPTTIAGYGITDAFSGSFTDLTNKPTTISGYGITDAKIQNGTITLGSNTITPITSFSSLDSPAVGGSGKYISSISETDGIISATETTLDTVPTENSTNAITSGAVYTDSANQQLEINYAINTGSKNKLIITNQNNTLTVNGITFTKNDDQTITATGTATANADYPLNAAQPLEVGQSYTLSGCPNGGGVNNFLLRQLGGAIDYGDGATFTAESSSGNFYIRIRNGYAIQGSITFKPMLRYEEVSSNTFEPYAPTNRELYETKTEQTETNVIANLGAKNLFPNIAISQTIGGVTFTVNDDGTVTANGTKTNNDWFMLSENNSFDAGTYTLSDGLPDDTTDCRLIITTDRSLGTAIMGTETNRRIHTKTFTTAQTGLYYAIRIASGKTVNNLTFKPMLRRAEITDDSYAPYAKTNVDLTNENENQQLEINYAINTGAKNLLEYNGYGTGAENGVTYTINADGTITVNGTPQGTGPSYIELKLNGNAANIARFCDGQHILSGCPAGGSDSTYRMYAARSTYSRFDYGNGVVLTATTLTDVRLVVYIANGYTANNLVFKPMIRRAEITDSTYVPYAPTNRELYELCETKASLNDIYGIKNQLPNGTDLNNLSAGIMMCPGATVAATLINCPTTTNAFIIYTDYLATTSRAIQRIYSFSTTTGIPAQYMRVRWSQGWTPWYQVMMQQVASASTQSVNQVSTLNLSRNDLDESLDTGFEPLDSITEKESESYNTDEELTEEQSE